MGIPQFSSPLQSSLDDAKITVDAVNAAVTALAGQVDILKNTDVANILTANKYTPLNKDGSAAVGAANAWVTVLNIANGKGFLTEAYVDSTAAARIRVTVDGVVKIDVTLHGLSSVDSLYYSTNLSVKTPNTAGQKAIYATMKDYPAVDGTAASVILSHPIFYNASLKIEISKTDAAGSVAYRYSGGVV